MQGAVIGSNSMVLVAHLYSEVSTMGGHMLVDNN